MKKLLFLDDFRTPQLVAQYDYATSIQAPFYKEEQWDIVCNYNEFVLYIEKYYNQYKLLPELISFDHDLADEHYQAQTQEAIDSMNSEEKTGYDCAKWLVDYCMDNNLMLPKCLCHSQNPTGKENITKFLDNFSKFQQKNK